MEVILATVIEALFAVAVAVTLISIAVPVTLEGLEDVEACDSGGATSRE